MCCCNSEDKLLNRLFLEVFCVPFWKKRGASDGVYDQVYSIPVILKDYVS